MKKVAYFLFISVSFIHAQQHELGLMLGGMYYMGDLNPIYPFLQTQPSVGGFYRYNVNSRMSVRIQGLLGAIKGDDNKSKFYPDRKLSFSSSIIEMGGIYELTYKKFIIGSEKYKFTPFLFIGAMLTRYNPRVKLGDTTYYLHQLGTEGQGTTAYPDRKPYSLITFSMPFGMGVKWNVTGPLVVGLEWGMRMTFTDYLDDCSKTYPDPLVIATQNGNNVVNLSDPTYAISGSKEGFDRGNPQTKDWYGWAGLVLTFKIKDKSSTCHGSSQKTNIKTWFNKLKDENNFIFNR